MSNLFGDYAPRLPETHYVMNHPKLYNESSLFRRNWPIAEPKIGLSGEVQMNVELPRELQTLAENLVASGRFSSVGEVLSQGVRLLASQERLRQQVEAGIGQADRGEVVDHDTVFAHLRSVISSAQDTKSAR